MKRLVTALAIITLAATLPACASGRAPTPLIPHENPATARGLMETSSFLMHFPELATSISPKKGESLTKLMEGSKYSHIAEDISYVVGRYQSVAPEITQKLDSFADDLDGVLLLLQRQQIEEASQKFSEIEKDFPKEEILIRQLDEHAKELTSLWDKAEPLASRLGVSTAPAQTKVQELKGTLRPMVDKLDEIGGTHETLERDLHNMVSQTQLRVATPSEAQPGLPLVIKGDVTSSEEALPGGRKVQVFLDDILLTEVETDSEGRFEVEMTPDPNTAPGWHALTIAVESKGLYAGVSERRTLHIVRVPCLVDMQTPARITLPTTVHVEGRVSSALGPLPEARVTLRLGKVSNVVRTSEDGGFSTRLNVPLDLALVGFQGLEVEVEPAEPWHAPAQAKTNLLIINPAHIGLVSAAFVAAAAVASTRLIGRRKEKEEVGMVEAIPSPERPTELAPRLQPEVRLEGISGRILEAYLKAMRLVEDATKVLMKPHQTLREFLSDSVVGLNGAIEAFTELTSTAERALYSPHTMDVTEATRAEKLATRVEEALTGKIDN